jgi:hypothetical protein
MSAKKNYKMKKVLLLGIICFAFAACSNQPEGEGAGNDTGTDVHNNMPSDTASGAGAATTPDTSMHSDTTHH